MANPLMLIITLAVLCISILIGRQLYFNNCYQDLKQTIHEAGFIRDELEKMLESSLSISEIIADRLDAGINNDKHCRFEEENSLDESAIEIKIAEEITPLSLAAEAEMAGDVNIRLYELARELEMDSKDLITLLEDMGFPYCHHLNNIERETADIIKSRLNSDTKSQSDSRIKEALPKVEVGKNGEPPLLGFALDELRTAHPYLVVRNLYEKGYNIKEIAQLLERGQGEVELILNLTQKKAVI